MLNIATENLEKVYDFILLSLSPQRGTILTDAMKMMAFQMMKLKGKNF